VLDGDIISLKEGKMQPFQKLLQKKRKYKVEEFQKKIPMVLVLFLQFTIFDEYKN
jgi:ATP-dependent DNA ligase